MRLFVWLWLAALTHSPPRRAPHPGLLEVAWEQAADWARPGIELRPARLGFARVDLHGPIGELSIEFEGVGRTLLRAGLLAGESISPVVPIPLSSSGLAPGAKFSIDARERPAGEIGRAAWAAELDPSGVPLDAAQFERERAQRWQALALGLRARPRPPPVENSGVRVPMSALCLALATAAACFGLRKRSLLSAGACILGAASIWYLAPKARGPARLDVSSQRCVLEHEYGSGNWLLVRSARGALELGAHTPLSIESDPADARVECALDVRQPWNARLQGPALWTVVESFDPKGGLLEPGINTLLDLEWVWLRVQGAQGTELSWSKPRPWRSAAPSAARDGAFEPSTEQAAAGAPPGWLAQGLPMGRSALLGKLRGGAPLDQFLAQAGVLAAGETSAGSEVWLRILGWPE